MKRLILSVCVVAMLFASISFIGCAKEGEEAGPTPISVTGSVMGGSLYLCAIGLARIIDQNVPEVDVTPETSLGSGPSIALMDKGYIEMAIISSIDVYQATRGIGAYEGTKHRFSVLMPGHSSVFQQIVLADSPLQSMNDLAGRQITAINAGMWRRTSAILSAWLDAMIKWYGIEEEDLIQAPYYKPEDIVKELREGRMDMIWYPSGIPLAAFTELCTNTDVRFLSHDPDKLDSIVEENPFYFEYTMEAGTYPGQDYDVLTAASTYFLVVTNDVDEELVYLMAKALYEHLDDLVAIHPMLAEYSIDNILRNNVGPWHPGVVKYFKEIGVWTTAMEEQQNRFLEEVE